jgi:hypothetical protein
MIEQSAQQALAVAEMMVESAARHAEAIGEAVHLYCRNAFLDEAAAGRLDPHLRRNLGRPSYHLVDYP